MPGLVLPEINDKQPRTFLKENFDISNCALLLLEQSDFEYFIPLTVGRDEMDGGNNKENIIKCIGPVYSTVLTAEILQDIHN